MAEATSVMPVRNVLLRIRGLRIHAQTCGEGEPLLSWSARCTSGARPTPWPRCTGWRRCSAGRACRGCGPSASPPLVLAGDDDPITPPVNHRIMAMLMPRAKLHIGRGGGHLVLLDSAEQVGPVITGFLRGD